MSDNKNLKLSDRSYEDVQRDQVKENILDARSTIIGLLIFSLLIVGMILYKVTDNSDNSKLPEKFVFESEPPKEEEVKILEIKKIVPEEKLEEPDEQKEEETPNIQVSTNPVETQKVEVVQTESVEVVTEISTEVTEMDIEETMEEIVETSDIIEHQATPIAVAINKSADIFTFKEPTPRNRPVNSLIARGPPPKQRVKVTPQQFGELNAPTTGILGDVNINLFGDGEFMKKMGKGGGAGAHTAVDAALAWLVKHQESDGHWIAPKWDKAIPDDRQKDVTAGPNVGITGFALLALMGGGHTIRKGDYRRNVLRGIQWLVKQQKPSGALSGNMYEHAIATIAICEAFGRAPDEEIGKAARKSINFCDYAVAKDGGWRYGPKASESDMSVTGWFIQALKTAKLANIKFDHKLFSNAMTWVDRATDQGGTRSSKGGIGYTVNKEMKYGTGSVNLGGAGMVIRQFSGTGIKSHLLIKAAKIQQSMPPTWKGKNFYRWYYTTYAMHNMGGEYRIWWNRRIRDVLLENQSKSGDQAGSWEPSGDTHGAGRVYTTALGALCLEVYYRYGDALRGFGTAPDLDDLFFE